MNVVLNGGHLTTSQAARTKNVPASRVVRDLKRGRLNGFKVLDSWVICQDRTYYRWLLDEERVADEHA